MKVDFDVKNNSNRLWLSPSEYKEGVTYAQANNIKSLFLWYREKDEDSQPENLTLDFSWLLELPEIIRLEISLTLSAKTNIESFYSLKKLESIVWYNYDKLPLDHERLPNLKSLYTHFSKNQLNGKSTFDKLQNLQRLKLWHIKECEDCSFLGNLHKLDNLELTWSRKLYSLKGIEKCINLESLQLRNLYTLEDVSSISANPNLKNIWVEGCKHINEDGRKLIDAINLGTKKE